MKDAIAKPPTRRVKARKHAPKLGLSDAERKAFRRVRLVAADLNGADPDQIAEATGLSLRRATELCASATFQALDSVGPAAARDLISLGLYDLDQLAAADPRALYLRLQRRTGGPLDPCVDDVFHCAVAQARDPDLPAAARDWWYWTQFRR